MFSFFASKITETGGIKPLVSCHPFPLFSLDCPPGWAEILLYSYPHHLTQQKGRLYGGFFAIYSYFFQDLLQQRRAS